MAVPRHKRMPEPQGNALVRRSISCNPYPYLHPGPGDTIDAFQPVNITWDPSSSCIKSSAILNIYLHDVDTGNTVHVWENVFNSPGVLTTSFSPAWWNMTSQSHLQLIFTEAGNAPWVAPAGPGPVFVARFNGSTADLSNAAGSVDTTGPSVEVVSTAVPSHSGLGGGKLAAIILFPILAVFGAIIGYILYCRRQTSENSKRWSAYVDQRMSQIAGSQWEQGAVRGSVAHSRPGSTASRLATLGIQKSDGSHHRPSFSSNRQSKVSFNDVSGSRHSQGMPSISSTHQVLKAAPRSSTSLDITTPAEQFEEPRALAIPMHRQVPGGRGVSNLRYELGGDLDIQGAMSMIFSDGRNSAIMSSVDADEVIPNVRNSRRMSSHLANEHITDTASEHSTQASVSTGVPHPRKNASSLGHGSAVGMRTLSNIRTSTLSPDEALKAYTMSRSQAQSVTGSPSLRSYASTINLGAPASPVMSLSASTTYLREGSTQGSDNGLRLQATPMLSESQSRSEELAGEFGEYELSSPQLVATPRQNNVRGHSIYTEGSRYSMISDGSGGPGVAR